MSCKTILNKSILYSKPAKFELYKKLNYTSSWIQNFIDTLVQNGGMKGNKHVEDFPFVNLST